MKCDYCGKDVNSLNVITDSFGNEDTVCDDCADTVGYSRCIRCGSDTSRIHKHGLCNSCWQVEEQTGMVEEHEENCGTTDIYEFLTSDIGNTTCGTGDAIPLDSEILVKIWIYLKLREERLEDCVNNFELMKELNILVNKNFRGLYGKPCKVVVHERNDKTGKLGKATICGGRLAKFIEV